MTQSTPKLDGVPRTMLLTLKGRADEQYRLVPLFSDPLAVEWSKSLPRDEELEAIYNWDVQKWGCPQSRSHPYLNSVRNVGLFC